MSDVDTSKMNWYVVHTHSGYEQRAKAGLIETAKQYKLSDQLGEIIIPMENVVEVKQGEKTERSRKFFPGYILVQLELSDHMWHVVKNAPRVIGFVGGGTKPSPIPEQEVNRIVGQMEEGMKAPKAVLSFQEGDQVRVIDGPFKNFSGVVEEVNPDKERSGCSCRSSVARLRWNWISFKWSRRRDRPATRRSFNRLYHAWAAWTAHGRLNNGKEDISLREAAVDRRKGVTCTSRRAGPGPARRQHDGVL